MITSKYEQYIDNTEYAGYAAKNECQPWSDQYIHCKAGFYISIIINNPYA